MRTITNFACISDEELLTELRRLAASERQATARLVAGIAELDKRRLFLALGYTSLFKYCTDALRLSEDATFARIEVARAVRRFPCLVDHLAEGDLTLTAMRLLAPHLTSDNHLTLLAEARHKDVKDVQRLIVRHKPLPPVAPTIRKLPDPKPAVVLSAEPAQAPLASLAARAAPAMSSPARRSGVTPLSEETYKVQFTVRKSVHDKFRRLQSLLRHQIPKGDLAAIFERAVHALLADVEKKKTGAVERPRTPRPGNTASRHLPAHIKRAVWKRDGGACVFTAPDGRRCGETGRVEYHHVVPYAAGGKTTAENLELRCCAHNRYEAEQYFGKGVMSLFRESPPPYAPSYPLSACEGLTADARRARTCVEASATSPTARTLPAITSGSSAATS